MFRCALCTGNYSTSTSDTEDELFWSSTCSSSSRSDLGRHHQGHDLSHCQIWAAVNGPHQPSELALAVWLHLRAPSGHFSTWNWCVCRVCAQADDGCLCRWRWTCRRRAASPSKGREEACLSCTTAPGCTRCLTATREEWRTVRWAQRLQTQDGPTGMRIES